MSADEKRGQRKGATFKKRQKWSESVISGRSSKLLGPAMGRTDFSRIFIFGPPDFFADFVAGFFLLIFVGKSAQKNPPGKSPAKSSKIYATRIPDAFLQRGRAKNDFRHFATIFVRHQLSGPFWGALIEHC